MMPLWSGASVFGIVGRETRGRRNVPKGYFGTRGPTEWQGVKTSPGGHSRHIPIESEIPPPGRRSSPVLDACFRPTYSGFQDALTSTSARVARSTFLEHVSRSANVYKQFNGYYSAARFSIDFYFLKPDCSSKIYNLTSLRGNYLYLHNYFLISVKNLGMCAFKN